MVFTDGSVYEGAVGSGAYSAVLIPRSGDDRFTRSKAIGKRVAAITCELEVIFLDWNCHWNITRTENMNSKKLFISCATVQLLLISLYIKLLLRHVLNCFKSNISGETVIVKEY